MKVERVTISIDPQIYAMAQELMRARRFTKFSQFLAQLIREEGERRGTTIEHIKMRPSTLRVRSPQPPGGPESE